MNVLLLDTLTGTAFILRTLLLTPAQDTPLTTDAYECTGVDTVLLLDTLTGTAFTLRTPALTLLDVLPTSTTQEETGTTAEPCDVD